MIASQWVWLAVALPLAGFLVNGALALRRGPAALAVSIVGTGVLLGAFVVSAGVFSIYARYLYFTDTDRNDHVVQVGAALKLPIVSPW